MEPFDAESWSLLVLEDDDDVTVNKPSPDVTQDRTLTHDLQELLEIQAARKRQLSRKAMLARRGRAEKKQRLMQLVDENERLKRRQESRYPQRPLWVNTICYMLDKPDVFYCQGNLFMYLLTEVLQVDQNQHDALFKLRNVADPWHAVVEWMTILAHDQRDTFHQWVNQYGKVICSVTV